MKQTIIVAFLFLLVAFVKGMGALVNQKRAKSNKIMDRIADIGGIFILVVAFLMFLVFFIYNSFYVFF